MVTRGRWRRSSGDALRDFGTEFVQPSADVPRNEPNCARIALRRPGDMSPARSLSSDTSERGPLLRHLSTGAPDNRASNGPTMTTSHKMSVAKFGGLAISLGETHGFASRPHDRFAFSDGETG